ncbi:zinc ribbon domain-containing protein YjdM [Enterobacter hormaechei]|uniref:zinc ribbon domain-containing protein YjdM n=1 Tax=Enterobacter hormaechei TaxID=158836 RepID=UPI002109A69F
MQLPHCPKCNSEYTYEDNGMFVCPECAHEWNDAEPAQDSDALIVKDANGNLLADGDSVTVVKDLKVKPRFYVSTSKSIIKALINMHSFEIQLSPIG